MSSTKDAILGAPKENTQDTVQEVTAPPAQTPVPKSGTPPAGNDGGGNPVNGGSAVVGAPAPAAGGGVAPPSSPATVNNGATAVAEPAKKAPLPTAQSAPAGSQVAEANQPANAPERKRMSYVEMFQQLSPYKPPTQEELEKERKKEKREKVFAAIGDGIAALSNLYFTTKGAPNAFDAKNSLSSKAKERWEKLKKERDENARYYTQAYIQAMREGVEDDRYQANIEHRDKREGVEDDRYQANIEHRDKREGIEDDRYNAEIEHRNAREKVEDEHWRMSFNETRRQFNITSAQNAQRIKLESARLQNELKKDFVTFAIGKGNGTISVPTNALNASNVSYVFGKLPANVRSQCQGEAVYDKNRRRVVGHKAPTVEAMLVCIGANIEGSVDAQDALREISGNRPKGGKKLGLK